MAWRLALSSRARRELAALPESERRAVSAALRRAADDFGSADVKKLSGRAAQWRLRVGRWRVLLDLDNGEGMITVARVMARDRAHRD